MRRRTWRGEWLLPLVVVACCGCSARLTREKLHLSGVPTPMLLIIEPSAIPRFENDTEFEPQEVIQNVRALSGDRSGHKRRAVLPPPPLHDLLPSAERIGAHLSGRYSKQALLRPPPSECVLKGAAPAVPSACGKLRHALRVQVRSVRFLSTEGEHRLIAFLARAAIVDLERGETVWTKECDLRSVDRPEVPGARGASEVNLILERAAALCASRLERLLREDLD